MLKQGRECVKNHRAELVIIQLFMVVCWLIPIVAELVAQRFVPTTAQWRTVLLLGSFFLNRLLLAPARTGYYACCRRLAVVTVPTAVTSEIEDLRDELTAPTLLSCFFLDYRHPWKSLKWQLRYDLLRFVLFSGFVFPAFLFIAVGAREETLLLQAICGGGGILCGLVGILCAYLVLLRLRPALYRRPQYGGFWKVLHKARHITRGRVGELLFLYVKSIPFALIFWCPFVCFRTALLTQEAMLFAKPPKTVKRRKQQEFHTRVLRDA
ncbi:MAG: hypothetical protein J6L00_04930 [Clostridia bacterium]|nr:hypothetical protein [Clostridia bacterium]